MSASKHTPGPWRAIPTTDPFKHGRDFPFRIQGADTFSPCLICGDGADNRGTAAANARLISAAPALLDLLASAIDDWPQLDDPDTAVSGADLLDWFCTFRSNCHNLLTSIEEAPR